jgi:NADPH:quinone reductase
VKAIYIEQHGSIDNLRVSEIARPSLRTGEVLVKIGAAGINPSDIVSVEGRFPDSILPRVVGRDFAGTVVEGSAEVIGLEVWGTGGDLGISRNGTHAEYVAIPEQAISRRPKNLSAEQAGAIGVPFVTAYSALVSLGSVRAGEWVLVSAAAGAVGQAAIQIARAKGAHVIALVKDVTQRWVSDSGEVQAIAQSDRGDLANVVREATGGRGADLALNGVGSSIFSEILGALAVEGRQVIYSAAGGRESTLDILLFYKHQFVLLGLDTQKFDVTYCADILSELAPLFESGAVKPPPIGERYPLSDAVQAYGRLVAHKGGKIIFVMPSDSEDS